MSIQPYEPATGELVSYVKTDLQQWAETASAVHNIAKALANTSFVPTPLRGRPDEIAAQILYGADLDMPPMVSLAQIHIIEGRPSISALAMRGMAQAAGVKFRYEEMGETRCKLSAMASGDADWTTVLWTIDRAKKLGVAGKKNWQNQPQAMLIARATSELCRLVAAPLFIGMPYSVEELNDGVEPSVAADAQQEAPKRTRTVKRETPVGVAEAAKVNQQALRDLDERLEKATPQVVQASFDNGPRDASLPADAEGPVTANTRRLLVEAFKEARITETVPRLAYVSDVVQREVGSVNDVTELEAQRVLWQLTEDFKLGGTHAD